MSFDLLPYRDAPLTCNCVSDLDTLICCNFVAVFLVESVGILLTNIVFFFGTHNVSFIRQLFVILLQILAKIIFCFRSTKDVGHNSILECQQVLNRY